MPKETYVDVEELIKFTDKSRIFTCQHYKFNDNRYVDANQLTPLVYELIAHSNYSDGRSAYVIPPTAEASIWFDNSVDSKIHIIDVNHSTDLLLYVMEMGTIVSPDDHKWVLADVSGRWTGVLYEREIISNNDKHMFIFLGRHRLIVKKGSRLAKLVKKYTDEGKLFAISELAAGLKEISEGNIDSEMAKEWPELV